MFVYDITNYSSFENLDDWLTIIERECFKPGAKPPYLALVANKSKIDIALLSCYNVHFVLSSGFRAYENSSQRQTYKICY